MVRSLQYYNPGKWKQHVPEILKPTLQAKYEQNEHLKASLLATSNRLIAEASPSDTRLWTFTEQSRHRDKN